MGWKAYVRSRAPALVPVVRFGKSVAWRLLPMRYRFRWIYRNGKWGSREHSSSGTGSNLQQTAAIRARLPALLDELKVESLLDIPCGDFYWMKEVDLANVTYVGADIVPEVIEANRRAHGSSAGKRFVTLNIAEHALPKVDLVLCRDCLVHLSSKDAVAALRNLKRSGSTYLLATTFPEHTDNPDVITGYWRPINLELPPFALPRPMLMINEGCPERGGADKSLGLWRIADLSA